MGNSAKAPTMGPDFAGAQRYALERLERELAPDLAYHSLRHTRADVLPAVERLAVRAGVTGEALQLLRTAAVFHDLGFIEQYTYNEPIGVRMAAEALPGFGYSAAQVRAIGGMILATRLPQTPQTPLEELLADADLDVLGRDDFWELNQALRQELTARGRVIKDTVWYTAQLRFLRAHRYFTAAARDLRDERKQQNVGLLAAKLAQAHGLLRQTGPLGAARP